MSTESFSAKTVFVQALSLWAELLTLAILLLSFLLSTHLGIVLIVLEAVFNMTVVLAIVFRYYFKKASISLMLYFLNRAAGIASSIYGFIYVFRGHDEAKSGLSASLIALYTVDIIVTLITFARMARWFVPVRCRLATLDDIPALLDIEASAFENEEHRATKDMIKKRMITSPATTFVTEHLEHGIIRSLYTREVKKGEIENLATTDDCLSWYTLNNNGDFTPDGKEDSLYIIGLQGLREHKFGTDILQLHLLGVVMQQDQCCIYGGLRLPGFAASDITELNEYIHSGEDKLLSRILASEILGNGINLVKGVKNYWDDPESNSCAALLRMDNPVYGRSYYVRALLLPWAFEHVTVFMAFSGYC